MEKDKPSNDSICPMCHQIPENFGIKGHGPYIWNRVANQYICEFCTIELWIEFYEENSKYFEMFANMMNLDIWELKKRYLQDLLYSSQVQLSTETDVEESEFLTDRIGQCKIQIAAIKRYLLVKNNSSRQEVIDFEYEKLLEALSVPAFDIDAVLPNLNSIEIP